MDKNFVIKCHNCRWAMMTTGLQKDFVYEGNTLHEIKKSCTSCGGPRKFRCPKCGQVAKMFRVKGNT